MQTDLIRARLATADNLRRDFDYGGEIIGAGEWREDGRDRLTSTVEIVGCAVRRPLMFRVCFEPDTAETRHIAVAERLTL